MFVFRSSATRWRGGPRAEWAGPDALVARPHAVPELPVEPVRPAKDAAKADRDAYAEAKADWDRQGDFLRCCRQRTITIAGAVVAKVRQPLAWGSDAWIESYSRRTHVEGIFGNVKSAKTADLQRGWIFIVGMRLRRWPGRNS